MAAEPLIVVGAGGHAAACIDVVELEGRFRIAGLVDAVLPRGAQVLGYAVIGGDDELATFLQLARHALVGVGQIKTPQPRERLFELLGRAGFSLPTIVSPRAYVSPHARLGAGTIVMHGAIVNARAVVGDNCIVNSRALIEHDADIGAHCHVSTGAIVNGGARVGARSFVGSCSSVREGVSIGAGSIIGMGEKVLASCPPNTRLAGGTRA
jgi:sugar O-acyltransferase (sialic acid O-acetyltransferase NeuD family)